MAGLLQPFDLPDGIILLITDELAAPADFLLHRTLASHLKDRKQQRALILSVSESISRWKALAAKSNINLQQHLDSGSLNFIDVLAEVQPSGANQTSALRNLLASVQDYIDLTGGNPPLVILDDISTLEWIGLPALDIQRFIRALRALTLKANATLLVRHHIVTRNEPDELFRHLLQICTYHLQVRALASGRSGAVSGEVSLHSGFSAPALSDKVKLIPQSMAMQYRLTDVGPEFFARGTSGGVL